jgi:hypothetical protein
MAAKRVDPLKAKAAKQKKLAIVLCVVFAGVLAFQVPRTLKMLKGPQPVASAAPAPATTTAADPNAAPAPAPAAPTAGVPAAAGSLPPGVGEAQPAVLVDSDLPALAGDGQLRSFEHFQTKDPFAQQAQAEEPAPAPAKPEATPDATVTTPVPGTDGTVVAPGPASGGGSDPAAAPEAPAPAAATVTSISINGVSENVVAEATFPAARPVFVLVSLGKDGKSVRIGIAGGSYADGAETIKLTLGKPLTLRNTADGSRYVLVLEAVAGFAPPAASKQ